MSFREDIKQIGIDVAAGVHVWRDGCVVEGHRGLLEYAPEQIKVRRKKGSVAIRGQMLSVACLTRDEVWIRGRVDTVCWYD